MCICQFFFIPLLNNHRPCFNTSDTERIDDFFAFDIKSSQNCKPPILSRQKKPFFLHVHWFSYPIADLSLVYEKNYISYRINKSQQSKVDFCHFSNKAHLCVEPKIQIWLCQIQNSLMISFQKYSQKNRLLFI